MPIYDQHDQEKSVQYLYEEIFKVNVIT